MHPRERAAMMASRAAQARAVGGFAGRLEPTPSDIASWMTTDSKTAMQDKNVLAGTVALPPWYVEPLASSNQFNLTANTASLAAVAGQTVFLTGADLTVAAYNVGVIRGVTIFIDAPTALTVVQFALLVNGQAPAGFDRLQSFPRVATNISIGFDAQIRLTQGDVITLRATNVTAAGPWTVGMSYNGWTTPTRDIERIFGDIGTY